MKKQVFNPYLPSYEYVPDGEPHVFGDRVYIYGSHDRFNSKVFCENDYVCWSAPVDDLSDWRYEGVIYKKTQDPKNRSGKKQMYAPDVARGADGRYYLYYAHTFISRIAVAVCDTPAGQYEYYGEVVYPDGNVYGSKKQEPIRFDPAVLVDDDGQVYLYTGFSPTTKAGPFKFMLKLFGTRIDGCGGHVVKLGSDMLTITEGPKALLPGIDNGAGTQFEGHEFYEASSIRKFNGKYYFIYSSYLSHELAYAVSDRPDGGYRYGGSLHSNANIGFEGNEVPLCYWGNNHGSVESINGKYYIFGHRQTNKHESSRQGVAEELKIDENGHFAMAEMTSCGLNGGPLIGSGEYEARIACVLYGKNGACKITLCGKDAHPYFTQEGVDRECDPLQYIADFSDGCVCGFKYFAFDGKNETISVKLRGNATGKLTVYTEALDKPAAVVDIAVNSNEWSSFSAPLHVDVGTHPLYFRFDGQGKLDFLSFAL